jgi:DNA adenine methylase
VGGKACMRDVILSSLPLSCDRYIEVFGGGGTILLSKQPSKFEVYNDYNSDLVNMFQCIKDKPLTFFRVANCFPLNSRQEFLLLKNFLERKVFDTNLIEQEKTVAKEVFSQEDFKEICSILEGKAELYDIERAVAFYKVIRYSYGAGGKSFGGQPVNLGRILLDIHAVADRMQTVVIENKDFESLIKQYDRASAAFYVDPPYFQAEKFYPTGFGLEDHVRLFECLNHAHGKFILSYNDCQFIKDKYNKFNIYEFSRLHSMAQRYKAGSQYQELLITNFDINERRMAQPIQMSLFKDEIYKPNLVLEYRQKRQNNYTYKFENWLRDRV